ncbi:hypothetical protein [Sediminibacillus massiliensis]|uniref:hypothetical protein n=1 Tax=Sediminibacillus massiliensis TaxID=1926277 RepID=UPI0009885643|nr:hypothetical protein [Sediminibacillus massiliensis]
MELKQKLSKIDGFFNEFTELDEKTKKFFEKRHNYLQRKINEWEKRGSNFQVNAYENRLSELKSVVNYLGYEFEAIKKH